MAARASLIVIFMSLLVLFGCSSTEKMPDDEVATKKMSEEKSMMNKKRTKWTCSGIQEERVIEIQ